MSMNKIQDVKLETTATYQPLSDLNVRFWSQDKNTAELRFIITRNKFPLSLSKENVKVIIALESGSNFISSDDFIIDSEVEGVARYIIPNDFMRLASNVVGQIYVTTLDGEEVIVERQFKFTVSNDLLNDYPSEDKLRYIKTFDDLRTEIASRVSKLESDMETMEDYVTQVQDTTQEGITALTKLIDDKEKAYNENHEAKMKELDDKGTAYSQQLDEDKQYMDEKFEAFKESVNGSGLVTTGQSKDWQKVKLTMDDGRIDVVSVDFNNPDAVLSKTCFVYSAPSLNVPSGVSSAGYVQYFRRTADYAKLEYSPNNSDRIFIKTKIAGIWSDWSEVSIINPSDPFETATGSQNKANVAENNAKTYTDEKYSKRNKILFEGSANGVGTVFNLNETLDNFIMLFVVGDYPGGEFATVLNPLGNRNMNINLDNVVGLDGRDAITYECSIVRDSQTKLRINSDNFVGIVSGNGSGEAANRITIQKIVGVYA